MRIILNCLQCLLSVFAFVIREVGYLLSGEEYSSGMNILPILVFAVYFTFMYQFPVNFEFFHRKTNIIAIGTSSSAILNIILNCIMIPIWGMYGAAISYNGFLFFIVFIALFYCDTYEGCLLSFENFCFCKGISDRSVFCCAILSFERLVDCTMGAGSRDWNS